MAHLVALNHPGRSPPGVPFNLPALLRVRPSDTACPLKAVNEAGNPSHFKLVAVKREQGQDLVAPSVVHRRQNHYGAIVARARDGWEKSGPEEQAPTWAAIIQPWASPLRSLKSPRPFS